MACGARVAPKRFSTVSSIMSRTAEPEMPALASAVQAMISQPLDRVRTGDAQRVCDGLHREPSNGHKIGHDIRFMSPLWKGLCGGFEPPSSCGRACAPARGRDPPASSLPNCRPPARQNPRLQHIPHSRACATGKADWAQRYGGEQWTIPSPGFETLLNDCQLLLGCPPPAADITRQQLNLSIRVRDKLIL